MTNKHPYPIPKILKVAIAAAYTLLLGGIIYFAAAPGAAAAAATDDFHVGDKVEVSVTGLEGDRYYEPCMLTEILNNGYRVKCSGTEYVVQKGWVRQPKVNTPPAMAKPEQKNGDDGVPANMPNDDDDQDAADNCDYDPPNTISNGDPFSAAVAKRKLYDNYHIIVRPGGTTSPLDLGVTFLTLQVHGSFTNIARGGYRVNDAAPVNATIYRISSKHIVCERYRDGTLRRQVESNYACFKNRDGEWSCGLDGIPKIIQLK